jgi:hypothetical protein
MMAVDGILHFKVRKKENWYIPYHMTSKPENCIILESGHYDLNLKCFTYRSCMIFFLLHFTKCYNIVNNMPGLALEYCTLIGNASKMRKHAVLAVEVTIHRK